MLDVRMRWVIEVYDHCLSLVTMEICENGREGGKTGRIWGCHEQWESRQAPSPMLASRAR